MAGNIIHRKRRKLKSEINVVPYIDVMLVLLIIFMVTAPLLTLSVDVKLPSMNAKSTQDNQDPVIVIAYADGRLGLKLSGEERPREVAPEQLETLLAPIRDQQGDALRVMLAGDADGSYQRVIDAMSILQRAQITNVSLVTDGAGGNAR